MRLVPPHPLPSYREALCPFSRTPTSPLPLTLPPSRSLAPRPWESGGRTWARSWQAAREDGRANCSCLSHQDATDKRGGGVLSHPSSCVHHRAPLLLGISPRSSPFDSVHTSVWATSSASLSSPATGMQVTPNSLFPQESSRPSALVFQCVSYSLENLELERNLWSPTKLFFRAAKP